MILALLLFQVATATPAATPAPVAKGPRTLADVARERKLAKEKGEVVRGGSFSAAGSTAPSREPNAAPTATLSATQAAAAKDAQERMKKAVKDGTWTNDNIHYHTGIQDDARAEWDAAAENCRKTPGCNPAHRENTRDENGRKPLLTTKEKIKVIMATENLSE